MAKLRMQCSNLNGHLYSMEIINSPAYSCGFVNENELTFLTSMCSVQLTKSHTSKCYGHIAPFTLRTLLYRDDNLDLTENKRIMTETLRFINDSKRFV